MQLQPWDIIDAIIPDYSAEITCIPGNHWAREYIAAKIQQVLLLSEGTVDYKCLPVFPDDVEGAYLPVGNVWYVNPLLLHHVAHRHLRRYHSRLSETDQTDVQTHVRSLYQLVIQQWCQRMYWARVPISEMLWHKFFLLKNRPVVDIKWGLYVSTTTNGGKYTHPGPVIHTMWNKPGIVATFPIFLPGNFFFGGQGAKISSVDKKKIQHHLRKQLLKNFPVPPIV